ncbi:unnamed protein product, partial [Phaeothamnion confervicola]
MPTRFVLEPDIPYRDGDESCRLDLLRPARASETPRPAVVYVHGGGWAAGHRSHGHLPSLLLARQGVVTATIGYRFSDTARFPAQIHDVKAAIRFLRANAATFDLDPDRIGIWGHSAGGHLAALAALNSDDPDREGEPDTPGVSSRVQAVVQMAGPCDFTVPFHHLDGTPKLDQAVVRLLGGLPLEHPDLARRASPTRLTQRGDAPMLILHGTADDVVSFDQAEMLLRAGEAAGNEIALLPLNGIGHDLPP